MNDDTKLTEVIPKGSAEQEDGGEGGELAQLVALAKPVMEGIAVLTAQSAASTERMNTDNNRVKVELAKCRQTECMVRMGLLAVIVVGGLVGGIVAITLGQNAMVGSNIITGVLMGVLGYLGGNAEKKGG
jgi:hypothetical protein